MQYRHLTDDELLNLIDDKRQHSNLIEELCSRLEKLHASIVKPKQAEVTANAQITCFVCGAVNHVKWPNKYREE